MRDNAASTDWASPCGDLDERSRKICPLAPRSHASTPITLEHGATVLDSLYTDFTETQRQAVDTLFASRLWLPASREQPLTRLGIEYSNSDTRGLVGGKGQRVWWWPLIRQARSVGAPG